ncbi:CBM35 domain-containing protein, partial [Allorhizocola rhizosphaerae]|uniref:CBM35 domain-containing protein n=1 Tax=Allorhizocola rhizosphaerae TaxID=1872709 RepID=UPI001FE36A98
LAGSASVRQQITVPAGTYTLSTLARTSGSVSSGQITVTDSSGAVRTLNIPASSGFTRREAAGLQLAAGTATVTIRAGSGSGNLAVDQLGLVKTSGGTTPGTQRYEAETAPATCQGTIDSNHVGFSGSGFCNGTNAAGAYVQFTANAAAAGTATIGVRFANGGTTARSANLIVNGTTLANVSFEPTGAWTTWVTKTLTVSLNAGSNTIRLDPTIADGLPNVDCLDVSTPAS